MEKATKLMELKVQKTALTNMIEKLEKEWDVVTEEIHEFKSDIKVLIAENYDVESEMKATKRMARLHGKRQGIQWAIFEIQDEISTIDKTIIDITRQIVVDGNF